MDKSYQKLQWVEALKAFAILCILLNHMVEEFGFSPWFSNPSYNWPDFHVRMQHVFPPFENLAARAIVFIGWLGDMGPGVFILLSGFTLTYSALRKKEQIITFRTFYLRRLKRIIPLYLLIHIIILYVSLMADKTWLTDYSPRVLISLSGLRLTDGLFFYINPSWWFIALILQFYFIFPLLYRLFRRTTLVYFAIITLVFTLLSRGLGLLDMTYSSNLYFWMTGMFFGTRLFEFTAGMMLAQVYFSRAQGFQNISKKRLFLGGLGFYLLGFVCSLFYLSTLISNVLISLGLGMLFLASWQFIARKFPLLKKPIVWIGLSAFPVFLLHQPFMQWFGPEFQGIGKVLFLFALAILTFPVARSMELFVNSLNRSSNLRGSRTQLPLSLLTGTQLLLGFFYFMATVFANGYEEIIKILASGIILAHLFMSVLFFLNISDQPTKRWQIFHACIGLIGPLVLFLLPQQWFSLYWMALLIGISFYSIPGKFIRKESYRLATTFVLLLICFLFTELSLRRFSPVEIRNWGELPALQTDSNTVYGLIPSKITHLRYNNYDYKTNTNSIGFNSPEIAQHHKNNNQYRVFILGDAFTMPEGMPYQKAYPYVLETLLNQAQTQTSFDVINAGVTGYGPNEMLASLKKYLPIIKPDLIINQLFINEFQEINIGTVARRNNIGLNPPQRKISLFGFSQTSKQTIFFVQKILKTAAYMKYMEEKSLVSFYRKDSPYYGDETILKMDEYLQCLKALCSETNTRPILLLTPGQLEISNAKHIQYYPHHLNFNDSLKYDLNLPISKLICLSESNQIQYIDLRDTLRNNPLQPVYFEASWHWNQEGHRVVAANLSQLVIDAVKHSSE